MPEAVDLALIIVPASLVAGLAAECAQAGVRHALIISSGFAESGRAGAALQDELRALRNGTSMRIAGPNSEGFFYLGARVPASFSPAIDHEHGFKGGRQGPVAVISQSGGLGFALFNRGLELGLGFSAVISTGNEVDLEFLDFADYLLDDPGTRVILGFVESIKHPTRLLAVARKAAERGKPIILAKMGRSSVAARAAAAHTGSVVGSDELYDAAFQQLGVIRVNDIDEMLDVAAYFCVGRLPAGRRVVILTPSGGAGTWLADACYAHGLEMPEVEEGIQEQIGAFLPSYASTANPVDITAGAIFQGGLNRSLDLLVGSERFDTIAVVATLTADQYFRPYLPAVQQTMSKTDKAIVYFSYTLPKPGAVDALQELGIPCYLTPVRTARALAWACWYQDFLKSGGMASPEVVLEALEGDSR